MSPLPAPSKILALLTLLVSSGCADIPDRLEMAADATREFAIAHPFAAGTALAAARAALRKPQRMQVMCNPRCRITTLRGPVSSTLSRPTDGQAVMTGRGAQ